MDLNSLRNRYALLSIALGILTLLGAIIANYLLSNTRGQIALNIDNRHLLLSRSRVIRNTVWQAREALGHFLIDPERLENRETIHNAIGEAINSTDRVLRENDHLDATQRQQILQIKTLLLQLDTAAEELINIRLDTNRQFPSLVLARNELLPRQQRILDLFNSAIQETTEEGLETDDQLALYQLLISTRHRWALLISNVRMLLTSRIGSFGLESIAQQQKDVTVFYNDFRDKLELLGDKKVFPNSGFLTETAIRDIKTLAKEWNKNYVEVLTIHKTDMWRGDVQHMRQMIDPLLEDIWHGLLMFDITLENGADNDVGTLSSFAQNQTYILWFLTGLGLFFVTFIYIYFKRSVLEPISRLSEAFSDEMHGNSSTLLPDVNTTEIKTLMNGFTDMRHQVRNRQDALEHQTLHDTLTGLANRTLLYERLSSAILQGKRYKDNISLIIMDLDRFKEVNDTLGHHVGDQLLIAVASRLRYLLRDSDTIARLGGDEFALLLVHSSELEARSVSRKILKAFEKPYDVYQHQLYVGASLGISIYPQHGLDAETLIKCADVAMYVAKRNRLGFTFYDARNDNYDDRYLALANDIRLALNNEDFTVNYQLKYDIASSEPIGVEVLLRWKHPELGFVSPGRIIPLAEQLGIINRLTLWVIEKAIQQCAQWRNEGIYMGVAVNMSVYDLQFTEIVDRISYLLADYDVPASYLVIEISESAMLIDPTHAIDILNKLDAMGVRIAIDDFGTGFSSLGYLKKLPVDELKIDKSFVIDMIDNENDAVIVRSTIDLAHNLGLKVVAEGVETQEIYELLQILDCDMAQGYYMSKPVSADGILKILKENRPRLEQLSGYK